jgi:hypothetical protein
MKFENVDYIYNNNIKNNKNTNKWNHNKKN